MTTDVSAMRVTIGADHAGVGLKAHLVAALSKRGIAIDDVGTHDESQPVDYPDIADQVAQAVREGRADRGVIICGSGVGACIAANKVDGIRAGLCHDTYSAHQGVEHDDVNVLVMGGRIVGSALAEEILVSFLAARFTEEERHVRRRNKVIEIEQR